MRKVLIGVSFFILHSSLFIATAQFAPFQDDQSLVSPNFRYDVIRMKKVASIFIEEENKPDGKSISSEGIVQYYSFDTASRLTQSFYTIVHGYKSWDTIRTNYCYDKGNLITKRTGAGSFFDSWYYVWYADGKLRNEAHVHEAQAPPQGRSFISNAQKVISCDSFAYNEYPKQLQQYAYNEENKLYKKVITQYDDYKRMTGRYLHFEAGGIYSQVDLKYDSVGRIKEVSYSGNLSGHIGIRTELSYDKWGNILTEKVYEGGKQSHQIEYLYDNTTGLISYRLDREYAKENIAIWKFTYTFLDIDDIFDGR